MVNVIVGIEQGGQRLCVAVRTRDRWVGVCRLGADEHRSSIGFESRRQAIDDARRIAALIERIPLDD